MAQTTNKKPAQPKVVSDQEAITHLNNIDRKLKKKNTSVILVTLLLLASIAANVLQYLSII